MRALWLVAIKMGRNVPLLGRLCTADVQHIHEKCSFLPQMNQIVIISIYQHYGWRNRIFVLSFSLNPVFLFSCQTQSHLKKKKSNFEVSRKLRCCSWRECCWKSYRKCSFKKNPHSFHTQPLLDRDMLKFWLFVFWRRVMVLKDYIVTYFVAVTVAAALWLHTGLISKIAHLDA